MPAVSGPESTPSDVRSPDADSLKRAAAERALELVRPGMLLGLGSGSTASYFIEGLGRLVRDGLRVMGVPTSAAAAAQAQRLGIQLTEAPDRELDLAVDGADEIDATLSLIKGRGGALLREKVVAAAARRFVVVADESKLVRRLGVGVLPVEVLPFMWRRTAHHLQHMGLTWEVRGGEDSPYRTDNGNLVLDLRVGGGIADVNELAEQLAQCPGVLEHGLFVGLTSACIVAGAGGTRVLGSLD
jgi:ribose 5-phosphate isomerase A